jgi:hypothetical protein
MGVWDSILKAKQNIGARIENAFGHASAKELRDVRQKILDQVESRIVVNAEGKSFPYEKAIVRLQPQSAAQSDFFKEAFLRQGTLKADVLQKLIDSQARYPGGFETTVELRPNLVSSATKSSHQPLFEMSFVKSNLSRRPEVPETKLLVTKGRAELPEYRIKKERILIGNLSEVLDREGRMVRKNDVVFLENGSEINSSVGHAHARIWFDFDTLEFCILDEVSRYGTRIVREGVTLEVPSGDTRGICLRSGDDIYFGQASLRFVLAQGPINQ